MPLPDPSDVPEADAEAIKNAFFEDVDQSGKCWGWTGPTVTNRPYGRFAKTEGDTRVDTTAHRFAAAWILEGGVERGNVVIQTCGDTFCVNPDHLQVCEDKQEAYSTMTKLGLTEGPSLSEEEAREVKWLLQTLKTVADHDAIKEVYGLGEKTRVRKRLESAERAYGTVEPKEPEVHLDTFLRPRRRELARAKWLAENSELSHSEISEQYDIPEPKVSGLKNEYGSYSPHIPRIRPEDYEEPEEVEIYPNIDL